MTIETNEYGTTVITAEEGKVFLHIESDEIRGHQLYLGKIDIPTNYKEIYPPIEENENELGTYLLNELGL